MDNTGKIQDCVTVLDLLANICTLLPELSPDLIRAWVERGQLLEESIRDAFKIEEPNYAIGLRLPEEGKLTDQLLVKFFLLKLIASFPDDISISQLHACLSLLDVRARLEEVLVPKPGSELFNILNSKDPLIKIGHFTIPEVTTLANLADYFLSEQRDSLSNQVKVELEGRRWVEFYTNGATDPLPKVEIEYYQPQSRICRLDINEVSYSQLGMRPAIHIAHLVKLLELSTAKGVCTPLVDFPRYNVLSVDFGGGQLRRLVTCEKIGTNSWQLKAFADKNDNPQFFLPSSRYFVPSA